jgi:MoaA/NifB/PqqE/SkfB family radical SAM enzyme
MDLPLACAIADLIIDSGAKQLAIFGGEPTIWPHLSDFNSYINNRVSSTIVTNGLRFLSDEFLDTYKKTV